LFASDRPVSFNQIRQVFKGTQIKNDTLRRALDKMAVTLASSDRGVSLEEIQGGFQLRTKIDNLKFISRSVKPKAFRLSGPALEVLSIVAYKQPLVKSEIDQIRGVESGHLLRAIMEKGLVTFAGKSELPGRPMLYETTRKFLEIFGLRNLRELPSLSQIDEILPEGMTEDEGEKTKLSDLTGSLSQEIGHGYSEGEEELNKISNQLSDITTSSEFFEQEKIRMKMKKDQERAQALRDSIVLEEEVSTRDRNWLLKYDEAVNSGQLDAYYAKAPVAQAVEAVAEGAAEELFETEEDSSNDADMGLLETDHEDEPEAQA
jgi:segregation and condensation protein B